MIPWPACLSASREGCAAAVARLSRSDAALLLAVGALRHYGWGMFPPEFAGMASKALGAVAILYLLWRLYSPAWWPLFAWWAWEEMQVVVCSAWYAVEPWTVAPGQAICSAKLGIDLGAFGIVAVAFLLAHCQGFQLRGRGK